MRTEHPVLYWEHHTWRLLLRSRININKALLPGGCTWESPGSLRPELPPGHLSRALISCPCALHRLCLRFAEFEPSPSFLTAVLLVALQAQAEPLQAKDEPLQASTYEADAQEQRGAENQDFTVSFAGDASSSLRALGDHLPRPEFSKAGLKEEKHGVTKPISKPDFAAFYPNGLNKPSTKTEPSFPPP
ncbi:PREDICTED: defensin-6 [Colobus angolensis palliatus]|uniref:defensin-6 n=1 Tax=Colobus angolensis palliatus TaxID=336983 RepID=UPI0005F4B0B4|nr:PREDICTED: defensin-6 [Colobus angolensis palliatus]